MNARSRVRWATRGPAVGGRLDPEEALPARLGEVDERAPVGRCPGGRERQPVGPVRVLEAAPAGGHGRPPGLGRRPPLLVVPGEALPDEGPGEHHGHGGEDHREPGPGPAGAGVDRLPRHRHRRHRGARRPLRRPSSAPGRRVAGASRRRTWLGTGGVPDRPLPALHRRRAPPARRSGQLAGRPGAVGAPRPRDDDGGSGPVVGGGRVAASPAGTPRTWPPRPARRPGAAGAGAGTGWRGWSGP